MRGINTKAQLAETEAVLQKRLRAAALDAGVTMIAPDTVFLSADTKFGKDVTIEPNVVFGPGVTVEDGATIRAFSHLEGAHVGKGARVGPFARLRPGADLGPDVHIGNFVEVKQAQDRGRRQGQPSSLYRRRAGRRGRQYRRRHHHLQLRRRRQTPHRYRQGRVHRLEFGAGGAGQDRRRRLCRLRLGDDQGRAGRRAGAGARRNSRLRPGWAKRLRQLQGLGQKASRNRHTKVSLAARRRPLSYGEMRFDFHSFAGAG